MDYTIDSIGSIKICQPRQGYRFSVDALMIAQFVNLKRLQKAVDIGAGTGIIGVILAKRYPESQITMIEIQPELAALAQETINLNNLEDRIKVLCMDAKYFDETGFDLIVSNPPFRRTGTGKLSLKDEKALARHELSLTIDDIAKIAQRSLKHKGRLFFIHLPERFIEITKIMSKHNLEIKRIKFVHATLKTEAKMVLIEVVKGGRTSLKVEPPIFIYNENGTYTETMEKIYSF